MEVLVLEYCVGDDMISELLEVGDSVAEDIEGR
jgi:hypothetical protein